MKNASHLASLLVVAAACNGAAMPPPSTGPDAGAGIDPTGNWQVAYDFAAACGTPETTTLGTFTVTYGAMGYDVEVAGTQSQGVLVCGDTSCKLSGTWVWAGSDASYQQSMNLTLASDSTVSGEGTEAVFSADGTQCTFPFTATGSRM